MSKHQFGRLVAAAAVLTLLMAACGSDSDDSSPSNDDGGSVPQDEAEVVDLKVGGNVTGSFRAAIDIGVDSGKYEECGLNVTIENFQSSADVVRAVSSGDVQLAASGDAATLAALEAGTAVQAVSGLYLGTSRMAYLVKKDSPIESVDDFEGKKIGVTSINGSADVLLRNALEQSGISADDVEIIAVGALDASLVALDSGSVDVSWASYPQLPTLLDDYKVALEADEFVEEGYEQAQLIASSSWAQDNLPTIERFVECTDGVIDYMTENTEEAGATYATRTDADPELVAESLEYSLGRGEFTTTLSEPGFDFNIQALIDQGVLDEGVTVDDDLFTDFLSVAKELDRYSTTLVAGS